MVFQKSGISQKSGLTEVGNSQYVLKGFKKSLKTLISILGTLSAGQKISKILWANHCKVIYFKGDLRPRAHSYFYDKILVISWRKNFAQSFVVFWSVFTSQNFELRVSDVIPKNVENISPLVFFTHFLDVLEKEPSTNFYGVFEQFSRAYVDYIVSAWVTSFTQISFHKVWLTYKLLKL